MLGSCNLNCRGHLDLHPNWASRLSSTDPGSISMQSNLPVWYSSAPTSHVKEYYPMSDIPVTNGLTHILVNSDSNQPNYCFALEFLPKAIRFLWAPTQASHSFCPKQVSTFDPCSSGRWIPSWCPLVRRSPGSNAVAKFNAFGFPQH